MLIKLSFIPLSSSYNFSFAYFAHGYHLLFSKYARVVWLGEVMK